MSSWPAARHALEVFQVEREMRLARIPTRQRGRAFKRLSSRISLPTIPGPQGRFRRTEGLATMIPR